MRRSGHTLLGWLVWRIGSRVARRKAAQNKVKLAAAAFGVAALLAGLAAARAAADRGE